MRQSAKGEKVAAFSQFYRSENAKNVLNVDKNELNLNGNETNFDIMEVFWKQNINLKINKKNKVISLFIEKTMKWGKKNLSTKSFQNYQFVKTYNKWILTKHSYFLVFFLCILQQCHLESPYNQIWSKVLFY